MTRTFNPCLEILPPPPRRLWPKLVKIAAPVDLAISKLGRFAQHDQDDIQDLIDCGFIGFDEFKCLASDAISVYVGNTIPVLANLGQSLSFFDGTLKHQRHVYANAI